MNKNGNEKETIDMLTYLFLVALLMILSLTLQSCGFYLESGVTPITARQQWHEWQPKTCGIWQALNGKCMDSNKEIGS